MYMLEGKPFRERRDIGARELLDPSSSRVVVNYVVSREAQDQNISSANTAVSMLARILYSSGRCEGA